MKIKTQLRSLTLLTVSAALIIGVYLFLTIQQKYELQRSAVLSEGIIKAVFELSVLTQDYLLHHEERAQTQWQLRHNSLTKLLTRAEAKKLKGQAIIQRIKSNNKDIKVLFSQLILNYKRQVLQNRKTTVSAEWQDIYTANMLFNSHSMVSDADQLSEITHAALVIAQQKSDLLIMVFVVFLAVIMAVGSFFISRSILGPVKALQHGTRIIGIGNLDYKIRITAKDEIGELSNAFNEMTDKLKSITASRDELDKEVSERKRAEEQLVQSARLASLGQLGAGIAHELNQPITTIQGFTQRIKRDIGRQIADHADELDLIINATHRMARIVDNIRTFSRQSDFKTRPIDPLTPLDDALMLISEQLRLHGIEVEKPADDDLPRVMGDQVKLQQVFSNLIMNARDSLETLPKDRPRRLVLGVRAEGDRVVYSVQDNGPGISEEDQAQIFDPFFTTKEIGQGTGLGLSISHGIVAEHGGEIRYEPVEGGGARFLVSLPITPVETTEVVEGHERDGEKHVG